MDKSTLISRNVYYISHYETSLYLNLVLPPVQTGEEHEYDKKKKR
jgi:hypothetical protein